MSESPYQRAAAKHWPGYTVHGDGAWAVVNRPLHYVELFDWAMLATNYLASRSDAHFCEMVELRPDYGKGAAPHRPLPDD